MKKLWKSIDWPRALSVAAAGVIVVMVWLVLSHLGTAFKLVGRALFYLSTFIVGLVIAYILSPMTQFFNRTIFRRMKRRKLANTISVILTYLVLFGIVTLILYAVIPQLVDSIATLASNLSNYYANFEAFVHRISQHEFAQRLGLDLNTILNFAERLTERVKNWLTETENLSHVAGTFLNVGTGLVNAAIAFVLSVYVLLDWTRFTHGLRRLGRALFGEKTRSNLQYFALRSDFIIKGFVRNNLLDALIIGLLNLIVMLILGMPYATLISFIVGLTNIIPTFGPIIGYIPSALILLLINPWHALWFSILTILLQSVDSSVIKPLVFKDAVGLPPLWVLVSIIVGARIGGIPGMLLAIPVTGILAFLLEDFIRASLKKKGLDDPPPPDDLTADRKKRRDLKQILRRHKRSDRGMPDPLDVPPPTDPSAPDDDPFSSGEDGKNT